MTDDLLARTLHAIQLRMAARGVPPQQVDPILREVDAEMRGIFGGDRAYVPARSHALRDRALCEEYASGHGIERLAHRYALTERHVRRILLKHAAISRYKAPAKDKP